MMARRGSLATIALVLAAGVPALAAQDPRPGVAVLAFENGGSYGREAEYYEWLRRGIPGLLISALSERANLRLVERAEAQRILEEQQLGGQGRVDAGTAANIGRLVGARYMITGTFLDLYGDLRLDARIIDVETGVILHSVRSDPKYRDYKDLPQAVESLAERIVAVTKLPALPVVAAKPRQVPTEAMNLYFQALLEEDRGELARAIALYEAALRIYPEFTEAQDGLAKARARRPGG
jgi:TolB-like protein